ncbi:MAG: transferase [Polyangiaceae bacterium]
MIQGSLRITGARNGCELLSIGTFTLISGDLHVDMGAAIEIGDQVRIGHGVSLLTVDHEVGPEQMRAGTRKFGPIEIEDGAWLASRIIVLPGVTIGAGSIVAAGAVVSRDVPPNTLVAGVPARVVRTLRQDDDPGEMPDAPQSSRNFIVRGP